jgi:hypothetical protein
MMHVDAPKGIAILKTFSLFDVLLSHHVMSAVLYLAAQEDLRAKGSLPDSLVTYYHSWAH